MYHKTGILFLISILFFTACRKSSQVISVVKDEYSIQEQKNLGVALDLEYQKQFDVLAEADYPEAYNYLSTLFTMILNTPSVELRDSLDWQLQIIHADDEYRIFTSPSGNLYISTGLLQQLNAENQIVALLSHQVYYVESGEAFNLIKEKNDAIEVGKVVLGEESTQLRNMSNTLLISSYSSEVVQAADEFQVNLLCPFKYNTTGMIDVFHQQPLYASLDKTMPWSNERATSIISMGSGCGVDDSLFVERYNQFKVSALPD